MAHANEKVNSDQALELVCGHCGTRVRAPEGRLGDDPKCPRCHAALLDGHPVELTSATFDRHLAHTDLPVVVDFWAPWCGPCRAMAPAFQQAAGDLATTARFAKLNTDEAQDVAGRYGIRSIPTLIVFHQGREVARQSGAMGAAALKQWVTAAAGRA